MTQGSPHQPSRATVVAGTCQLRRPIIKTRSAALAEPPCHRTQGTGQSACNLGMPTLHSLPCPGSIQAPPMPSEERSADCVSCASRQGRECSAATATDKQTLSREPRAQAVGSRDTAEMTQLPSIVLNEGHRERKNRHGSDILAPTGKTTQSSVEGTGRSEMCIQGSEHFLDGCV